MNDTAFETRAEAELSHLADRLESASQVLEVDFEAGILTIELPDGRQYLLNRHSINREIWLSSPVSGAHHFTADGEDWRSTRGSQTLRALVAAELAAALGHAVVLD